MTQQYIGNVIIPRYTYSVSIAIVSGHVTVTFIDEAGDIIDKKRLAKQDTEITIPIEYL